MAPSFASRLTHQLRAPPRSLLIKPATSSHLHHLRVTRPFSTTTPSLSNSTTNKNPQHAAQLDREKMNTDANEYSKSGTDDTASANEDAAFDTDTPKPEQAKKKAGEGNQVNPLDASPANQEISQPKGEQGTDG